MIVIVRNIIVKFFNLFKYSLPDYPYRLVRIEKDETDNYSAVIQVRNKKEIFRMSPEEILSNDDITDSFSQRDIRTLTYLGYLGINSPKYKILAKRLCENDSKLVFAIQERGNKKPIIKTVREICMDENILTGLNQKDAHMVGYIFGTEQTVAENNQKDSLKQLSDN